MKNCAYRRGNDFTLVVELEQKLASPAENPATMTGLAQTATRCRYLQGGRGMEPICGLYYCDIIMKRINLNDVKHPVCAFIIVAVVAITLKGGAEWSNKACALTGEAAAEVALFAKEYWDKEIRGKFFDWFDVIIGQIGVVLGFLCARFFM